MRGTRMACCTAETVAAGRRLRTSSRSAASRCRSPWSSTSIFGRPNREVHQAVVGTAKISRPIVRRSLVISLTFSTLPMIERTIATRVQATMREALGPGLTGERPSISLGGMPVI